MNFVKDDQKIGIITVLRGVAAISVCIVHIGLLLNFHVNKVVDFIVKNGQQGVLIFFVISGFVLPYSLYKKDYVLKDFFRFLIRRSIRIDPPYWFTIILLFVSGRLPIYLLSFTTVLLHVFYLVPFVDNSIWYSSVFWTLAIEFQFYVILGLLYPWLNKINVNYAIAFLISVSAIIILMGWDFRGIILMSFHDFATGYIAFFACVNKISKNKALIILLLFSGFVMWKVSYTYGIIPLATAYTIIFLKDMKRKGFLEFPGKISYSLYLIHMPTSVIVIIALQHQIKNNFVLFPLCLAASILFAYLFYLLLEKPSMALAKKIKI